MGGFDEDVDDEWLTDDDDYKSKSQVKRELAALRDLGRQLTELSARQLQQLPLEERTRQAIVQAQGMKKGALKRQIQHIGVLMRDEDEAAVRQQLDAMAQPHRQQVQVFHQLEQWRDALMAGDNAVIDELSQQFPALDRQHLMQLVRNARKEQQQDKPPKSARVIFQYLKDLQASE